LLLRAQLPQQPGTSQLPTGLRNMQSSHVLHSYGGGGGPAPAGSGSGELDWPQQPRPHSYDNAVTPEAMAAMVGGAAGGGGGGGGGGSFDPHALASLSAQARPSPAAPRPAGHRPRGGRDSRVQRATRSSPVTRRCQRAGGAACQESAPRGVTHGAVWS